MLKIKEAKVKEVKVTYNDGTVKVYDKAMVFAIVKGGTQVELKDLTLEEVMQCADAMENVLDDRISSLVKRIVERLDKQFENHPVKVCPICGDEYKEPPAISRIDNETEICSECGADEAVESIMKFMFGER